MIEAVIFDMDGVLADSEPLWTDMDAELLAQFGVAYAGEHKLSVMGKSFPLAVGIYKETYGLPATIDDLCARREVIAKRYYATRIETTTGAAAVLQELQTMKLPLALATSGLKDLVYPFLRRARLEPHFNVIVTGEQVALGKPNPDIYLAAAERLGVAPAGCLVVEDALPGAAAGMAAGMQVVGMPDERFTDCSLFEGKCHHLIANLDQLPSLVRQLNRESEKAL